MAQRKPPRWYKEPPFEGVQVFDHRNDWAAVKKSAPPTPSPYISVGFRSMASNPHSLATDDDLQHQMDKSTERKSVQMQHLGDHEYQSKVWQAVPVSNDHTSLLPSTQALVISHQARSMVNSEPVVLSTQGSKKSPMSNSGIGGAAVDSNLMDDVRSESILEFAEWPLTPTDVLLGITQIGTQFTHSWTPYPRGTSENMTNSSETMISRMFENPYDACTVTQYEEARPIFDAILAVWKPFKTDTFGPESRQALEVLARVNSMSTLTEGQWLKSLNEFLSTLDRNLIELMLQYLPKAQQVLQHIQARACLLEEDWQQSDTCLEHYQKMLLNVASTLPASRASSGTESSGQNSRINLDHGPAGFQYQTSPGEPKQEPWITQSAYDFHGDHKQDNSSNISGYPGTLTCADVEHNKDDQGREGPSYHQHKMPEQRDNTEGDVKNLADKLMQSLNEPVTAILAGWCRLGQMYSFNIWIKVFCILLVPALVPVETLDISNVPSIAG